MKSPRFYRYELIALLLNGAECMHSEHGSD